MRACGQKLVKFCTLTHAAKLVVRVSTARTDGPTACSLQPSDGRTAFDKNGFLLEWGGVGQLFFYR